jgi:hypothetical protein
MPIMTRRDLLVTAASAASLKLTGNISLENPKALIRSARLGAATKLEGSRGDTWVATWAHDDNLYITSDDTSGIVFEALLSRLPTICL